MTARFNPELEKAFVQIMEGSGPTGVNRWNPDGPKFDRGPYGEANLEAKMKRWNRKHGAEFAALEGEAVETAVRVGWSPQRKVIALNAIFDKAGDVLSSVTPCKANCGHCCYQAVGVTEPEAKLISDHLGKPLVKPEVNYLTQIKAQAEANGGKLDPKDTELRDEEVVKYAGKPCTFLAKDGNCSIYEVRPMACRTYFSIEADNRPCQYSLNSGGKVINPNTSQFVLAQVVALGEQHMADIRDWFPNGIES
jgi:Fe-S-cluster containining protein